VNYYPHNIGDYCRKLSARTRDERKTVETILYEFFELTEAGWIQLRCDREITAYQSKAEVARGNGKLGGRPKKTEEVISKLSNKTEQKANQEPVTISQQPGTINQQPKNQEEAKPQKQNTLKADASRGSRLPADWVLPASWEEWAAQNRPDLTSEGIRKIAEAFKDHWISQPGRHGTKVDWEATWRNWIRNERPSKALSFADRKMQEHEQSQAALHAWAEGKKSDTELEFIEGELVHVG
jgi:uncharacterized protein YdaU (DUF1376 family)